MPLLHGEFVSEEQISVQFPEKCSPMKGRGVLQKTEGHHCPEQQIWSTYLIMYIYWFLFQTLTWYEGPWGGCTFLSHCTLKQNMVETLKPQIREYSLVMKSDLSLQDHLTSHAILNGNSDFRQDAKLGLYYFGDFEWETQLQTFTYACKLAVTL